MMITDPLAVNLLNPSKVLQYTKQAFFAIGVLVAGKLLMRRAGRAKQEKLLSGGIRVSPESKEDR
jgi:hypothetical protein